MSKRKGIQKLQDDDGHLSRLKKNALDQKEPVVVKTIIDTISIWEGGNRTYTRNSEAVDR